MEMILLDTCTLIWTILEPENLSKNAFETLKGYQKYCISSITAFELGQLTREKRIKLPNDPLTWLQHISEKYSLKEYPINTSIAFKSTQLPLLHKDPADRIIIATAMEYNIPIITPDKHIKRYKQVKTIW